MRGITVPVITLFAGIPIRNFKGYVEKVNILLSEVLIIAVFNLLVSPINFIDHDTH